MSELYAVICPHCQAAGQLSDPTLQGTAIYCPACSKPFVVAAANIAPSSLIAVTVAAPVIPVSTDGPGLLLNPPGANDPPPTDFSNLDEFLSSEVAVTRPSVPQAVPRRASASQSSVLGLLKVTVLSIFSSVTLFGIYVYSQKAPQRPPREVATNTKMAKKSSRKKARPVAPKSDPVASDSMPASDPSDPSAVIQKLTEDADESVLLDAITALALAEPKLPEAIPPVEKGLDARSDPIKNMRTLLTKMMKSEDSVWMDNPIADAIKSTKTAGFGALVSILSDPQSTPELRIAAGQVLALSWRTGWEDAKLTDVLRKMFADETQPLTVRAGCAVALLKLKDPDSQLELLLLNVLTDETVDWQVREAATNMIPADRDELLSTLVAAAEECEFPFGADRSDFERQKRVHFYAGVMAALERQKSSNRSLAIPSIVEAILQDDRMVKMAALDTIATWKEGSADAVEAIREALQHDRPGVRATAFHAIGQLHTIATVAIPDLRNALKSDDDELREHALKALGEFGPAAIDAVPDLLALLADEKQWTASAIEALIKIAPQHEKVVTIVSQALEHPDRREDILEFLEQSIPAAQGAVPILRKLLANSEGLLRLQLLTILSTTGEAGKPAVPEIVSLLGAADAKVRIAAVTALGRLKQHAAAAAHDLIKLLKDPDAAVQDETLLALSRIGRWAKTVIPDVENFVANTTSEGLKWLGQRALEKLKADPGDGDPELFDALLDEDNFFEFSKAWEKQTEPQAKAVLKLTLNNNESVRNNAWSLLSDLAFRPQGRQVLQRLLDESEVREKTVPSIMLRRVPADVNRTEFAKSLFPWIKSERTNDDATWLLLRLGPPAASELANVLTSEEINPFYRARILDMVCEFPGFESKPLLAQLKPRFTSQSVDQKRAAALAVSRLDPRDLDALPGVLECLVDSDHQLKRHAIIAIRGMAEAEIDVTATIPELMKIITEEVPLPGGPGTDGDFVLQAAFGAMQSIRARPQELPQLRQILSQAIKVSKTANERKISQYIHGTIEILATVEPSAAEAFPEIKSCVEQGLAENYSKDGYGECLAKIGEPAFEMLNNVVRQANNAPAGRRLAIALLAGLVEQDERSIATLTDLLKDPDRSVRVAAAAALTENPKSAAFNVGLPVLRQLLLDQEPLAELKDERRWIVERLLGAGAKSLIALPELIRQARDPAVSSEQGFRTITALLQIAPESEEVKAIYLKCLCELSEVQAQELLSPWHNPPAKEIIKHLTPTIQAAKEPARTIAISLLANLGEKALPAVPTLRALATADQDDAGLSAAIAIAQIDASAKDVVPRLLDSFLKDPRRRRETSLALRHLGPNAVEALPALLEAVKSPASMDEAFAVIGSMGVAAKPALPILRDAIRQDPPNSAALAAISEMGPAAAELAPELLKLWKESRLDDWSIIDPLTRIGDPGRAAVDELLKDLPDETKRLTAIYRLGHFGALAVPAIPELSQFVAVDDLQLRLAAINAISKIGPAAKDAASALANALNDPDPRVAEAAAIALGSLNEHAQTVLTQIISALEKPRRATQLHLIDLLANLGPAAKEAIPVLSKLAKSPVPALKWRARYAMDGIESPAP